MVFLICDLHIFKPKKMEKLAYDGFIKLVGSNQLINESDNDSVTSIKQSNNEFPNELSLHLLHLHTIHI